MIATMDAQSVSEAPWGTTLELTAPGKTRALSRIVGIKSAQLCRHVFIVLEEKETRHGPRV